MSQSQSYLIKFFYFLFSQVNFSVRPFCDNAVYCLVPIFINFQYSKFISISNITLLSLCHFQRCHYSTFYFYLPLIDFPATLESFTKVTYMPVQYLSIFHIQILSIFQYYSSFFSCCQSEIEYRSTVKYAHQIAFQIGRASCRERV